jgi:putative transposase
MQTHNYWERYFHLTWHTKFNRRSITPDIEGRLYQYIRHKVAETRGAVLHAIGGTEDHIHLAVSFPPSLLESKWIGELKGGSSRYINSEIARRHVLEWQRGYGSVTFGQGDLPWVIRYVENQKQHHAAGTTRMAPRASNDRGGGGPR